MAPTVGNWYIETDKKVRLYCVEADAGSVGLSYDVRSPIAVRVKPEDFQTFFRESLDVHTALRNLLDVIGAPPERNAAGDVTSEQYHRLGEAVLDAELALRFDT